MKWIENWTSDRRQRVLLNGISSDWVAVTSGVPQGSVLGPVLFTIHTNDIYTGLTSTVMKFSDDTTLMGKAQTSQNQNNIQKYLEK